MSRNRLSYEYEPEFDPVDSCTSEYEMMRYFNCRLNPYECEQMIDRMNQHYRAIRDNNDPFARTADERCKEQILNSITTLKNRLTYYHNRRTSAIEYVIMLSQLIESAGYDNNTVSEYTMQQYEYAKRTVEDLTHHIDEITHRIEKLSQRLIVIK